MRNRRKALGDIRFHPPPATPPRLVDEDLQGIVRTSLRAEPERAVQHVGFEDRLEHDLARRLHDPIADSGNRQRPLLFHTRFGNPHPARRQRPILPRPQLGSQLIEQPFDSILLDLEQGGLVDTRCTRVGAHRDPRPPQDVSAEDSVPQRVKPSPGIGLGRPVQRMLQSPNRIQPGSRRGGTRCHRERWLFRTPTSSRRCS